MMPYSVTDSSANCSGWAVVKDGTGEVMGCHDTQAEAQAQLTALNIAEYGDRSVRALPDNYRPAISDDVPEGRACGNCTHYEEDIVNEDGVRVWCELWADWVRGDHYCDRWAADEDDEEDDDQMVRQVELSVPRYIRQAAARGLELNADGFGGGGLTEGTLREARAMARGQVSEDKVVRASAWGARHAVDLDAPQNSDSGADGWPGAGAVAHYLWGIDPLNPAPARAWFDGKSEQIKDERGAQMDATERNVPTDNLVRAAATDGATTVSDDGRTLYGHFSMFNNWYEISSTYEGRFLERIAPGAFDDTLARNGDRIKVLYDHGMDPQLGNKPLGTIRSMGEDKNGAYYEVALIDTDYNRNFIIPAAAAGLLGSSFRFRVIDESWNDPRRSTSANPERLPERTITKLEVFEFGPVTFPANPAATAAIRSATDDWHDRLLHDPKFVARFTERVGLLNVERVLESIPKRDATVADATSATVSAEVDGPHSVRSETPKAEQPADGRSKARTKNQRLAAVAKALPVEGRKP
jgi:HK97 family phage prohead protease